MKQVQPYLTFRGECQEALSYYRDCFNAKIVNQQTYENASIDIPEDYRNKLQHAELKGKGIHIMAYDAAPDTPLNSGNQVQMSVALESEEELTSLFDKFTSEGQTITKPEKTSWNALYARCKDKYGVYWMLNYQLN
ncbi:PhnB protein [Pustulibacterium marinum]|uniref:PhnB protein n=1 Tax=Pustulibacterium marinum TaxID=1224947 RepID=A0A1I7IJD7_9FLAO|nr:VOC family protein [Pustulibacterium marinum]SFU73029.1 PhnB protein [Pustulibacterium marinum]